MGIRLVNDISDKRFVSIIYKKKFLKLKKVNPIFLVKYLSFTKEDVWMTNKNKGDFHQGDTNENHNKGPEHTC